MTGKELLFVLGGATLLGAGAGAGAAALGRAAPVPAAPLPDTAGLERRMEALEKSLAVTRRERDELREALAGIQVRVREAEAAAAARPTPTAGGFTTPTGGMEPIAEGEVAEKLRHALVEALDAKGLAGWEALVFAADGHGELGELAVQGLDAAAAEIHGLTQGLRLRALPEEERWKKAREELGLSEAQVDEIKSAVADRDRAMEEGFVTETVKNDGKGGSFTLRRLDPEKASSANRDWDDRISRTLTQDQRSKWRSGGYDGAFGKFPVGGGVGTGAVIAIESEDILPARPAEGGGR